MNVSSQSNDHILQTASLPDSWKLTLTLILTPTPKRLFPHKQMFFPGSKPQQNDLLWIPEFDLLCL